MRVEKIVEITRGRLLSGDPDIEIDPSRISTDSRSVKRAELFLALKGPNFDGSDFIEGAFKKGAIGAIVTTRPLFIKDSEKIMIVVKDTTRALEDIALYHRRNFKIPVIAVTGSNGKTTVKDMIWSLVSADYDVLKNEGTKNNHIGLPQTLLKLKRCHELCVLELGTNHRGEIRNLARVARPTVAVITNIGPSHLEFLGDLNGVYEAKKEIFEFLDRKKGLAVLNGDDEFLSKIKGKSFKIVRFGFGDSNDFRAEVVSIEKDNLKFVVNGKWEFELNLLGVHNIYNALAAIAVASKFGVSYRSMKNILSQYRPPEMRLSLATINGVRVINDSYNSNPMSMNSALETIKYYPAKARWVVSGDMLELGEQSVHFHRMAGRAIAESGANGLVAFGKLSRHTVSQAIASGMSENRIWHCSTHDEVATILRRITKKGDVVLLKGSRGMKMEEVLGKFKTKN